MTTASTQVSAGAQAMTNKAGFLSDIQVCELPEGAQYILPRRPPDFRRKLALALALTVLMNGCAVRGLVHALPENLHGDWPHVVYASLLGLVQLGFIGILLFGFVLLMGQTEINVDRGVLKTAVRLGPLRWSWGKAIERLDRVEVRHNEAAGRQPGGSLSYLAAERGGVRLRAFALFYPPRMLEPLAAELTRRCRPAVT